MIDKPALTDPIEAENVEIVIIEDDLNDAELILQVFRKLNLTGQCIFLKDGAEGVEYLLSQTRYGNPASRSTPRVIFLDLGLHTLDGIEVLRRLKAEERTRRIPVVVWTSSTAEQDLKTAYELGVNSYVTRPIPFDELTNIVKELIWYWLRVNKLPTR